MTKKLILLAFIALFSAANISAQLLWKVSGNGLSKSGYLFGTHHLIEKEQIKNFDQILALAAQSDAVVGEIEMSDMSSMQAKIMQSAMMQGKNIKDMISAADYAIVDAEFKQLLGAGLEQLGVLKPMMLQTLFVTTVYLKSQNLAKQPEAVDILFQKAAKENSKAVIGLETVEKQAAILFDSLPLNRQAEVLVKSVKEKQKGIELLKRLNAAYLTGDLAEISKIDKEDDDMTPAERKPIYDGRNLNWVGQLPALLKKQSCFVAVGCMHLVGETGLIAQLKKAGFKVEPVVFP